MVEEFMKKCSGVPDGSGDEVYSRLLDQYGSGLHKAVASSEDTKCRSNRLRPTPGTPLREEVWVAVAVTEATASGATMEATAGTAAARTEATADTAAARA